MLARRRNTTTGASAASARAATPDSIPDGSGTCDEDLGDGHANDLLERYRYLFHQKDLKWFYMLNKTQILILFTI